ncbi:RdgB/HAM1 family non-canonical purine NTP pyrophosphatase [Leadbettera azotonutricia]|uniref:dITP/XTP pyrophosphatase n=1 Tax=Leadbettera azotonutricia (strain ATCC BAA-888 / DSM 13862 / ZAS-9) TaxID=545695 RepID=F5YEX1_LEAAZ|nr:RdgB/HAM1 family non-canonical purine NTP pyrophosphatase [Leadbettera azotonutricia]AEF81324.1 non-canonical purine NTP pyrophosphatase, RdgB/HAM1 family [Leadbettera azotonutricia ZAS-9]
MTIWFATGNTHKKAELAAILGDHTIKIPSEAGISFDPEETGSTFLENALIKARALYHLVKEPVIADDSGICVDALGGKPGIYSARYGSGNGQKLDDSERNTLLLKELGDTPLRSARFVCSMVLLFSEDRFFAAQETLEGEIVTSLENAKGKGGFGYDPILRLQELDRTVAELGAEEKNRLSHRGKAGQAIAGILAEMTISS